MIAWSLEALSEAGCAPLFVAAPEEAFDVARRACEGFDVVLVPGGQSRQRSIAAGLSLVEASVVVVHDAARPLVTPAWVQAALAALERADGAIVAAPMDETVKRARDLEVIATVDRGGLWRAQTPQAFRTAALVSAHARARAEGFEGTDDSQLVERNGGRVVLVEVAGRNVKLTWPEDFAVAEAMLGTVR